MNLILENIALYHGDCLEVMKQIPDSSVDMILTDPPYDIKNTNTGGGSNFAKSLQLMNNEIREANIINGYNPIVLDEMVRVCKGINIYIFCNKIQLPLYFDYFLTKLKCSFDLIKWVKTNALPTFYNKYLTDTEYCFYARKHSYCKPANYKDASTLYHAPINTKDKKKYGHPTIKPLGLIEKLVKNSSKEQFTVLDPFMGSGTTGVACMNLNRKFIGIELDEDYFNISCGRISQAMLDMI